jgi:hypothetical protein
MLVYGHRFIPSKSFYHVLDIQSILNTPPSSIIYVEFSEDNLDIINHTRLNHIDTAIYAKDITQIIYASSFGAMFIVVHADLAKNAQKIANDYLFDAKILVMIDDESQIQEFALLGVDGVIFPSSIVKINS